MTPDLAIAWLLFSTVLIGITLVFGIFRYRRGLWYRKLSLKVQAYLLWGIGGVALLSCIYPFAYLYTEQLWFESVNYGDIFWKIRKIRWGLFFGFFFFALAFMNVNAFIAKRLCPEAREFSRWTHDRTVSFHRTLFFATIILAILLAVPMMSLQDSLFRYFERPTEKVGPILFGKDLNFYLFSYSLHKSVSLWVLIMLLVSCGIIGILYNFYYRRDARSMGRVKRYIIFHGTILWLMLLATNIWRIYVNLWGKVYTPPISKRLSEFKGLFFVDSALAGATQLYLLIHIIIGTILIFNLFWRKRIIWYALIGIWAFSQLSLLYIYPIGVNLWVVESQGESIEKESAFLTQHILATRRAFDLDGIEEKEYKKGLATLDTINRNEEVKNNIQFWDRRVLYNILRNEEIKRHHDFHPFTDVDRYRLGSKTTLTAEQSETESSNDTIVDEAQDILPESTEQYRQVMIAAREIDPDPGPKEWGELKLKFTHGYGVCVAPVNEIVSGGASPDLWVRGVPITQKEGLSFPEFDVTQPRIYYGEMTDEYVIVNTKKAEYNIEKVEGEGNGSKPNIPDEGDADTTDIDTENKESDTIKDGYHYQGTGGVQLGGWFRRLCFAVRFTSVRILRHAALTEESRLMFWRRIGTRHNEKLVSDRISRIAPFLDYDPDPYIVIHDGQLWWIVDFYVTSNTYPNAQTYKDDTAPIEDNDLELYAEPRFKRFRKFNYIRNSGVVVVNAYNGDINFYTDIEDEVITGIYRKTFPNLFKRIDEMPEGLREHRRFPDYLTRIQAKMYGDYHVVDSDDFVEKTLQLNIPKEAYYSETPDQEMMPYYVMLKLPGEEKVEFVNMIPFTPPRKENFMKGWMIARCDPPNYGQRIVYTLPGQMNVKGPKHVEDDIAKNSELAELFRNWRPNKIIRGNLHVIPIEEGIFYVEPIYFERTNTKETEDTDPTDPILHLPTLQTIVVKAADHDIAADISFEAALQKMFFKQQTTTSTETENGEKEPTPLEHLDALTQALDELRKSLQAEQNGNGQKAAPKNAGKKNKKKTN